MKHINGTSCEYSVTSQGEVISHKGKSDKVLTPISHSGGYLQVILRVNGRSKHKYIHRLVAEAYLPNDKGMPQVNHKNLDKTCNNTDNLEWCTSKQNLQHSIDLGGGGVMGLKGKGNPRSKAVNQVCIDTGVVVARFFGVNDVKRILGFTIHDALRKRNGHSRCKGFLWEYA